MTISAKIYILHAKYKIIQLIYVRDVKKTNIN